MYHSHENHPDGVVICPYNKSHKIARSRFQKHLVKCEKNFPEDYLEICPFNATHRFPKEEKENHINSCPMKRFLDSSFFKRTTCSNIYSGLRKVEQSSNTENFTEYWSDCDDDSGFESVEPKPKPLIEEKESKVVEDKKNVYEPLRPPYGYSQMMLMDNSNSEDDEIDDDRSVISCLAMGRGRIMSNFTDNYLHQKLIMGRGKRILRN